MSIEAIYAASTFYTLQALKVLVKPEFGQKSGEKLLADILEYESKYVEKLSIMFFDYSVLVCYGEMRHASSKTTHYIPGIRQRGDRAGSYSEATNFNPMNILGLAEKQFGNYEWHSSFGGKKWANIAHTAQKKGRIDNLVFCDTCFSLSHNCSPYVNKSEAKIFKLSDCDKYKQFLDTKFSCEPEIIIESALDRLNKNVLRLVCRAKTLGYIKRYLDIRFKFDDHYHQKYEDFVFAYTPINWGKNFLPCVFEESYKYRNEERKHDSDRYEARPEITRGYDCDHTELHIGDEVVVTESGKHYCNNKDIVPGKKGIVKHFNKWDDYVGVEFSEKIHMGHSLKGHCKYGYGWSFAQKMVKKVADATEMSPVESKPKLKTIKTKDFNVGDIVVINESGVHYDDNKYLTKGKKGKVIHISPYNSIGVDFAPIKEGHKLNGKISTPTGWFVVKDCIDKVILEETPEEPNEPESEYETIQNVSALKVGDKVIVVNKHFDSNIILGYIATIKDTNYLNSIGVEFEKKIFGGHDLNGCCEYGYGWYFSTLAFNQYFKLIKENKKSEDAA